MQKFILLLIIVIMAYCFISIAVRSKNYSLLHFKKVITNRQKVKIWVLLGGILCLIILIYNAHTQSYGYGSGIITLNYSDASKAQNANKTRFSVDEILSDEVMENAIKRGGFAGISKDELRRSLSINPVAQGNSFDEKSYHISTEFRLVYTATKATKHLIPSTVIQITAQSFKEIFIKKYARDFSLLEFREDEKEQFKNMDYYDIASYLTMRANNISLYMYELAGEGASFHSKDNNNFSSMAVKTDNINKEMISNDLMAYIKNNGISKNKAELLKRLSYTNVMSSFELQKVDAEYKINNRAVAQYAPEMTRIALIPTVNTDRDYYMGRTKLGIDDISLAAKLASEQAGTILADIQKNSAFADKLRASQNGYGSNQITDKTINRICDAMLVLSDDAKKIALEYNNTRMNGIISILIYSPSQLRSGLEGIILSFIFFAALYALSVTKDYLADITREKGA